MEIIRERIFRLLFSVWVSFWLLYSYSAIGSNDCQPIHATVVLTMFVVLAVTSVLAIVAFVEYEEYN